MGLLEFFKKQSSNLNPPQKIDEPIDDIEIQKEGYLELINVCVEESIRKYLVAFFSTLKNHNEDCDYMTTLNFVLDQFFQKGVHLFIVLDWKQEIQDLKSGLDSSLRDNFNIIIDLPAPDKYGEQQTVSHKNVFNDYDQTLRKINFQLSFIDTNSDEYVIVVHKTKDELAAIKAIKKMGYECLNARSPKISPEY